MIGLSIPYELLVVLALVLLNGVFAGAEIALVTLRQTRVEELVRGGRRGARAVAYLRSRPERFLATVQVGITVVGAGAAAYGGSNLAADLEPLFDSIPLTSGHAPELALVSVVAVVSYLSIVLGELVPKSIALVRPEGFSLLVGRPLVALSWMARPAVWFLTASSNAVLALFGQRTTFTETNPSSEELHRLIQEAARAGEVEPRSSEVASRALKFGDLSAKDVRVPPNQIDAIPLDANHEEVLSRFGRKGHARMPVFEGDLHSIAGYVTRSDVMAELGEGKRIELRNLLRPALFVPETVKAVRVFQKLQRQQLRMALLVDEMGGLTGLVTMEDLVEELVGELFSEQDSPEGAYQRQGDGVWRVRADTPVRDVNRVLGASLPESDRYTTMAGLCNDLAGKIPSRGTRLELADGPVLEVAAASSRRVRIVLLRIPGS